MIPVSQREIARYLGYHGIRPTAEIQTIIDVVLEDLQKAVRPGIVYKTWPCTINGEELDLGPIHVHSKDLVRNLKGCEEVILLGATLGTGADYQIHRFEKLDIVKAAVAQAASAAMIEAYIDQQQEQLRIRFEKEGLFMRPRFSPGYGDFSLTVQPEFLSVLQMRRYLGVSLTDGLLMVPSKTVTAVIGLARTPYSCLNKAEDCATCSMESCAFRRMN